MGCAIRRYLETLLGGRAGWDQEGLVEWSWWTGRTKPWLESVDVDCPLDFESLGWSSRAAGPPWGYLPEVSEETAGYYSVGAVRVSVRTS